MHGGRGVRAAQYSIVLIFDLCIQDRSICVRTSIFPDFRGPRTLLCLFPASVLRTEIQYMVKVSYTSRLQKVESPLLTVLNLRCTWLKSSGSLGLPYLYFLPLLARQEYLVRELYTTDPRVLRDFPPLVSDICLPENLIRDTLVFRPLLSKYSSNKKYPIEREATIIFHYFV